MKINETGRSMIEMLGVLAIIGVLSVGGIAGYSKAMSVHRVNKTIDQLTQIVANTRALFAGHKVYNSLSGSNAGALIYKSHLAPDDMIASYNSGTLTLENAFGGAVTISASKKVAGTTAQKACGTEDKCKAFSVSYAFIPQASCMELVTKDWGAGKTSGLFSIIINSTEKLAANGSVSITDALAACTSSNDNTITWTFY